MYTKYMGVVMVYDTDKKKLCGGLLDEVFFVFGSLIYFNIHSVRTCHTYSIFSENKPEEENGLNIFFLRL